LVPPNKYADKYVNDDFYADVCLKDENDVAITNSIRVAVHRCGTVNGKRAYYNMVNDGSGNYQSGKILLLVNDKSFESGSYDRVQPLYVPVGATNRCGLFVSVSHKQFVN